MSNWRVRNATTSDYEWCLSEGEKFMKWAVPEQPFNREHIVALFDTLRQKHLFLVVEQDGQVCGMLGCIRNTSLFSPQHTLLVEIFWWVAESHRNTRAGALLLNAMERAGTMMKVDKIVLSTVAIGSLSGKSLQKRGFVQRETSWVK